MTRETFRISLRIIRSQRLDLSRKFVWSNPDEFEAKATARIRNLLDTELETREVGAVKPVESVYVSDIATDLIKDFEP